MIPQANITAWRAAAPWSEDAQVEQDLVLSRAIIEMFSDLELAGQVALRGGAAFNKIFIHPASRFSEDIDLVQTKPGPIGPLLDGIRDKLDSWLGKPARASAVGGVSLVYRFESEIAPVRPLRLKIEINTREHFTVLGLQHRQVSTANPWFNGDASVTTFELDELLATKMRALYQRRKGRDLFDLWLCIGQRKAAPDKIVTCFLEYMKHEGHSVSRAEFEQNLIAKETDPVFLGDITPLLSTSVYYDAGEAMKMVRHALIEKLPGAAWRGTSAASKRKKKLM